MAFTTEFVMGAGGGVDIQTIPGVSVDHNGGAIYSFTLSAESIVSVILAPLPITATGGWGAPTPELLVEPAGEPIIFGVNRIASSQISWGSIYNVPAHAQSVNARWLSLSGILPPGDYDIKVNTRNSSRSYTLGESTLVIIPT